MYAASNAHKPDVDSRDMKSKLRRVFSYLLKTLCYQDDKERMKDPNIQALGEEDDSEKYVVIAQPCVSDVTSINLIDEPEWIKRFFRASPQEGPPGDNACMESYFQSDDEEEIDPEDDDETSLDKGDNELSVLPFKGVEFCYPGQDYDEIIQP